MAIARVGGSGAVSTVSNGSSLPISYTPAGTGNLLTVSLSVLETGTLSTPTVADSSSTSWTLKSFQKPADQYWAAHGYRENNPSGLTSVTSTFPANTYARGQVSEWSGVATSSSYDSTAGNVTASAGAASSLASGSLTSSGSNSLILGVASTDDSLGSLSWNTTLGSFTQLFAQEPDANGGGGQAVYQIASGSAGPFSITWSLTGSQNGWASLFIAFLPAGGAAAADESILNRPLDIEPVFEAPEDWTPQGIPVTVRDSAWTLSPGGTIVFSGSSTELRTRTQVPSGLITLSGGANQLRTRIQVPSGLIVFSGSAALSFTPGGVVYIMSPGGFITFSGSVTELRTKILAPTGLITFSGSAPGIRTRLSIPTGQIVFGGSSPMQFIPAGTVADVPQRARTGHGL